MRVRESLLVARSPYRVSYQQVGYPPRAEHAVESYRKPAGNVVHACHKTDRIWQRTDHGNNEKSSRGVHCLNPCQIIQLAQRNPVMQRYKERDKKLAAEKSINYPIHPQAAVRMGFGRAKCGSISPIRSWT